LGDAAHDQSVLACIDIVLNGAYCVSNQFGERNVTALQFELTVTNSRRIEQVVHKHPQLVHLPLRDGQDARDCFIAA